MKRAKRFLMNKYDPNKTEQKWINISKIIVKDEESKQQLLLASRYIHNLRNIDTDYMGANMLAHLYSNPNLIEVEE